MADLVKISKIKTSAGEHEIDANYWGGKTIDVLNDLNNMEEITYSDLNILKTGSKLIKGKQYRITDYVTTTTQENTQSAGHSFDIIVTADSNNTFNEVARACLHSGDTYFSGVNMDAWEIKYSFDNDTNRFAWASSSGKGVIYYMKDEWNNECPYDFKNIKFKRDSSWISSHKSNFSGLTSTTQSVLWFYTFSRISGTSTVTVSDDSLNNELSDSVLPCRNNSIGVYSKRDGSVIKCYLNDTIFIGNGAESNHFGENSKNNTFTGIYNNYFDMGCQDNIAYKGFSTNNIGINFKNNIITDKFQYNNIDTNFNGNQLGQFLSCSIGDGFKENNSLGQTIKYCDFGHFIQRCSDLPSMMNVVFDNEIVKNTDYNKGLKNITLSTGETAYNALERLSDNTSKILFTKQDDVYYVVSVANHEEKLEAIHDLGSFSTNGDGENAAYNINIIRNPKILFIKFYNEQKGKDVYIQQMVVDHNCSVGSYGYAKQYIYLDGKVNYRKCWFTNALGNYQTVSDSNHNSNWVTVEDVDGLLYSGGVKTLTVNDATNFVALNGDQTITGSKTFSKETRFNGDINIAGKTKIWTGIDPGELKVFKANDSSAGFTIRTNGKFSNNVPILELLATNNNAAYKYQFPQLANTTDPDFVVIKSQLDEVIEDEKKYVYIEWGELVSLKDNGELKPGRKYRITDYVTTTSQENTQSAGHQFDIIVEALNENTLSENAKAIQNENDGYFDGSNLEAWELKYCLDNDNDRFSWADTTNGKGVIYYMKDEFNNECPYDFKNIQFVRYKLNPPTVGGYGNEWQNKLSENVNKMFEYNQLSYLWHGSNSNYYYWDASYRNVFSTPTEETKAFYTFSNVINDVITDKSLTNVCYSNVIKENCENKVLKLNNNIFFSEHIVNYCYNNSFGDNCYNNSFGDNCYSNSFLNSCTNNSFGNDCYSNSFGNECHDNSFGNSFHYNSFGNNCSNNSFGINCESNSFGDTCYFNSFGYTCCNNSFGNNCYSNSFLNSCTNNSFGNSCYKNTFGDSCGSNSFLNSCTNNSFGNSCTNNSFGNNCGSNSFGNYFRSNSFGDSCISNIFDNSCISNSFGNDCYSNSFGEYCQCNTFGEGCESNSFSNSCYSNSFSNSCVSNSLGEACGSNSFSNSCGSNSFGNTCNNNSFGNACNNNTFGDNCDSNSFSNTCYSNTFGDNCDFNSFGDNCDSNSFGDGCRYNSFGNYCYNNSFGNSCYSNSFGNTCYKNTFGNYCHRNTFGNECALNGFYVGASYITQGAEYIVNSEKLNYVNNITISEGCNRLLVYTNQTTNSSSSNCVQNITITKGVKSIRYSSPLTILISDLNNEYEIKVAKNTSGELKIYCEADLIA